MKKKKLKKLIGKNKQFKSSFGYDEGVVVHKGRVINPTEELKKLAREKA